MASPDVIDFDRLLAPISETSVSGENLRQNTSPSSPYYLLKDARKAARDKERRGAIEAAEVPDARTEWRSVFQQAETLLAEHSKDLEITAWLIEALVRLHGFAGLRDGFRLARELLTRFWDSCYPVKEDGVEERVAPLAGLNGQDAEGTLIVPIRNVAITEGSSVGPPFASWHFQQAVALQQIADPAIRDKRVEAGAVSMDLIDKASVETDASFFKARYKELDQCLDEFNSLDQRLEELCGVELAPPSSNIRNELIACQQALRYVGKSALDESGAAEGTESGAADEVSVGEASDHVNVSGGYPRDREQAFKTLLQLADFFRRNEPHSPLSYTIEQAVRWGRMPLPDLMDEIIADENARQNVFRLAGIRKPDQEGK